MTGQLFRLESKLPPEALTTFGISSPPDTSIVVACKDAGCPDWRHGWDTTVDESTDLGKAQAAYIRQKSGRTFIEMHDGTSVTVFRFEPYQRCFAEHRTLPERYYQHGGDHRGNPRGDHREFTRPADWAEASAEHQQHLADRLERG